MRGVKGRTKRVPFWSRSCYTTLMLCAITATVISWGYLHGGLLLGIWNGRLLVEIVEADGALVARKTTTELAAKDAELEVASLRLQDVGTEDAKQAEEHRTAVLAEKTGSIMFCHARKAGGTTIVRGLMPLQWVDRSFANICTTSDSRAQRKKCSMDKYLKGNARKKHANDVSTAVDEQPLDSVFRYNEFEFNGCPTACMDHDRENTLWILNARDPVTRAISEFWYSGPGDYLHESVSVQKALYICFAHIDNTCLLVIPFHFCAGACDASSLD